MNLLDPDIHSYVIKWDRGIIFFWHDFNAEIQKENGEKIGKIVGVETVEHFKERNESLLFDIDGSVLLTVREPKRFFRLYLEVMDSKNDLIGTVKRKIFSRSNSMKMKNSKGDEILTSKNPVFTSKVARPGEHEINSMDGKSIAKFSVKEDVAKKGFLWRRYYYIGILQINDLNFDRKTLFGMFIANLLSSLAPP